MFVYLDGLWIRKDRRKESEDCICGLGERCAELRRRLRKGWGLRAQEGWEGRMGAGLCGWGRGLVVPAALHLPLGLASDHHVTAT